MEAHEFIVAIAGKFTGVTVTRDSLSDLPHCSGTIDNCSFQCFVTSETIDHNTIFFLNLVTKHKNYGSSFFSITKEMDFASVKGAVDSRAVKTGDDFFDRQILVSASKPEFVMALLHREVRSVIDRIAVFGDEMIIDETSVTVKKVFPGSFTPGEAVENIARMVMVSKSVNKIEDIKQSLINNLLDEREPGVCRNLFAMIKSMYKEDDDINSLMDKLLHHSTVEMQIMAAKNLGQRGLQHIVSVIDSSQSIDDTTAFDVIETISENKYKEGIPALMELYNKTQEENVKVKILEAFQFLNDESVSPFLAGKLEGASSSLVKPLVRTLGFCGTREEIEPIRIKTKSIINIGLGSEARKAIDRIKSRMKDGGTGWLSVNEVDEKEGQLSIKDDAGEGALSKSEE
jgi:hypothetical protein